MKKIRLRYAPSPTGYLHIGNTRTALMNFLFAKHHGGDFIIRIEDTDFERNVDGAIESQFENMDWLKIVADESYLKPNSKYGEYLQSKKLERYNEIANQLIFEKKAYRCFCTIEELEIERERQLNSGNPAPQYNKKCLSLSDEEIAVKLKAKSEFNIRFNVLENKAYSTNDIVRGSVTFESKEIGDFVIIKSNGVATYNFAVVVDDFDMEITHVVRGEEHISNTPKQLIIYEAMNWEPPLFCHLTLIVDENRKKLSKRSGNALFFISQYKEQGYLPEAIFNYISLLGWSPKGEKEIFSIDELIKEFDESRFSKSPSTFDMIKMKWFNSQWIKLMNESDYLIFVKKFLNEYYFLNNRNENWLNEILLMFKNEIEFGTQINNHLDIFYDKLIISKEDKELLKLFNYKEIFDELNILINSLNTFDEENIKKIINEISIKLNLKGKNLFMPIRILCTKISHGPELAKTIKLIGKDNILKNLEEVIEVENEKI